MGSPQRYVKNYTITLLLIEPEFSCHISWPLWPIKMPKKGDTTDIILTGSGWAEWSVHSYRRHRLRGERDRQNVSILAKSTFGSRKAEDPVSTSTLIGRNDGCPSEHLDRLQVQLGSLLPLSLSFYYYYTYILVSTVDPLIHIKYTTLITL